MECGSVLTHDRRVMILWEVGFWTGDHDVSSTLHLVSAGVLSVSLGWQSLSLSSDVSKSVFRLALARV
jgi:hypothetical protein